MEARRPDLRAYELPVLATAYRLVDREGATHWRTDRPWDAAKGAALDAVLAR